MGRVLVGRDVRATSQATTQKIRAATVTPCVKWRRPTPPHWAMELARSIGYAASRFGADAGTAVGRSGRTGRPD